MKLPRATALAQDWVRPRIRPGDWALDATAGNGHDTVFLAGLTGPEGRVYAFDVQAPALEATRRRLLEAGLRDRVDLIEAGHETMLARFESDESRFRAIMFNLGYLPGSDHAIMTRAATTLAAIDQALQLVSAEGLITLVLYPGHEGGGEEAAAVVAHVSRLDPERYRVVRFETLNAASRAPALLAIELTGRASS